MTECRVPAAFEIPAERNASDVLFDIALEDPDRVVFRRQPEGGAASGEWSPVTAREAADTVTMLAKGLIASGVEPGDRVALLSATRIEWTLIDFAIWSTGATTVPIYDSSSSAQIDWIMEDSGARTIIVDTAKHRATAEAANAVNASVTVFQIEPEAGTGLFELLAELGKNVSDETVTERRRTLTAASPATLIYTSGTTGRPKGCMLTHSNLIGESGGVLATSIADFAAPGKRFLLFLPMAHVLARAINLVALEGGLEVGYTSDIPNLVPTFAVFRPSLILSVPRVFEKIYNASRQKAHDEGKGKIFDLAAQTAIDYSTAVTAGERVPVTLRVKHKVFDRLVFSKLRDALGGRVEVAVSGGAPLGERLGHFFSGIGVPVYEGYGLTETTAAICFNTPDRIRMGTVGRPLPGHAVRIAEDGEIMLQGPVVFTGYWHNDEATAEAIEDNWFHTGDLGTLDSEGFLKITGRKKEIIVTAGGKNVSPAPLEDVIRAAPLVSQAMVVGDQRPFIGALVTVDQEAFPAWKERTGKPAGASVADLANDPDLIAEIQPAIDEANLTVSHAEAIKKFRILPHDFSEETGELTPTMKVKRKVVLDKHGEHVDALYTR